MRRFRDAAAAAALALVLFVAPAHAATARPCESLASLDLSKVADKPAHIETAKQAQFLGHAVCEVAGFVEPQVNSG